ncbi:MAG: PLP-dependent aminotransferase family protein [Acidobacteria bacterium]|nr:PLP-dependent aminotransferase family protein [Acidobacteriota bacterium]
MGGQFLGASDLLLHFDPTSDLPIYLQLYEQLRSSIVTQCRLGPGAKLPSTRAFADSLGVSRNTVLAAFEQLLAEGYLEGRAGSGTYVARTLPEAFLGARHQTASKAMARPPARVSERGRIVRALSPSTSLSRVVPQPTVPKPFRMHTPAFDNFPYETWRRLTQRAWDRVRPEMLGYGSPAGWRPLREAIAQYVRASRAVRCEAGQVIITAGAKQAMHFAAQMLTDPGESVFIENPSYSGVRVAFQLAGARLTPLPVDGEGMVIAAGAGVDARLAYVTPSHQYPVGVTMSLRRRLELLDWARRASAWVIEDDYDSEFRYRGRPVASLQGLDDQQRVIYIGTFSKVLMPSMRLAYMIVPPDLVDTFIAARAHHDWQSPIIEQVALTDFINEGHFGRHIRRMRAIYADRQRILVQYARQKLRGLLEVPAKDAGMHLLGWLPQGVDDLAISRDLMDAGVETLPLSQFAAPAGDRGGLLLGYAPFDERDTIAGIDKMALVLERQLALS